MQYTNEQIEDMFTYHNDPEKVSRYRAINQAAILLFVAIQNNCPDSADRQAAFRMVREARMTANAAIALDGRY